MTPPSSDGRIDDTFLPENTLHGSCLLVPLTWLYFITSFLHGGISSSICHDAFARNNSRKVLGILAFYFPTCGLLAIGLRPLCRGANPSSERRRGTPHCGTITGSVSIAVSRFSKAEKSMLARSAPVRISCTASFPSVRVSNHCHCRFGRSATC